MRPVPQPVREPDEPQAAPARAAARDATVPLASAVSGRATRISASGRDRGEQAAEWCRLRPACLRPPHVAPPPSRSRPPARRGLLVCATAASTRRARRRSSALPGCAASTGRLEMARTADSLTALLIGINPATYLRGHSLTVPAARGSPSPWHRCPKLSRGLLDEWRPLTVIAKRRRREIYALRLARPRLVPSCCRPDRLARRASRATRSTLWPASEVGTTLVQPRRRDSRCSSPRPRLAAGARSRGHARRGSRSASGARASDVRPARPPSCTSRPAASVPGFMVRERPPSSTRRAAGIEPRGRAPSGRVYRARRHHRHRPSNPLSRSPDLPSRADNALHSARHRSSRVASVRGSVLKARPTSHAWACQPLSSAGIAAHYAALLDGLVRRTADEVPTLVTDVEMADAAGRRRLARDVLGFAAALAG